MIVFSTINYNSFGSLKLIYFQFFFHKLLKKLDYGGYHVNFLHR